MATTPTAVAPPEAVVVAQLRAELAAVVAELEACRQERDDLLGRHLRLQGKYRALKYRPPSSASSASASSSSSSSSASSSSSHRPTTAAATTLTSSYAAPSHFPPSSSSSSSSSSSMAIQRQPHQPQPSSSSALSTSLLYASSLPSGAMASSGRGPVVVLRGTATTLVDPMAPSSSSSSDNGATGGRGTAGRRRSGRAPHAPPPALLSPGAAAATQALPAPTTTATTATTTTTAAAPAGPSQPKEVASLAPAPTSAAATSARGMAGPASSTSGTATRGAGRRLLAGVGLLLETSASAALTGGSGSGSFPVDHHQPPSPQQPRPAEGTAAADSSVLAASSEGGLLNGADTHRVRINAATAAGFVKAKKQRSEESEAALFEFDEFGACAEEETGSSPRDAGAESEDDEDDDGQVEQQESAGVGRQRYEIAEALQRDEMAIYASSVPVAIPRRWVEEREDKKTSHHQAGAAAEEQAQAGLPPAAPPHSTSTDDEEDEDTFVAPHIYSLRTTSVLEDVPRSISYRPYWNDHAGQ